MSATTTVPAVAPVPQPPPPANTGLTDKVFKFIGKKPLDAAGQLKKTQQANLNADKKNAKEARKGIKKEAKAGEAEVLYRDRLARMESTKADVERLRPGADEVYTSLAEAIAGGRAVLAKTPTAFAEANKALHEIHLGKVMEQAEKAQAGARKDAREAYPDVFVVADEINRLLGGQPMLTAKRTQEFVLDGRGYLAPIYKPGATDDDAKAAKTHLSGVLNGVIAEQSAAEAKRAQMEAKTRTAQALFEKAGTMLTAQKLAPMQAKLNSAAGSMAEHDYDAASATLDLVLQDAGAECLAEEPFHDAWLQRRNDVPDLKKRIAEQHGRLERGKDVRMGDMATRLNKLATGLTTLMEELPFTNSPRSPEARSYRDAVGILTATASDIDAIEVEIDKYDGFTRTKNGLREEVRTMFTDARKKLPSLEDAVAAIEKDLDPKLVSEPFRSRLDDAQAEWRRRWPNAFDLASLDADAAKNKVVAIAAEIDAASSGKKTAMLISDTKADVASNACTLAVAEAKRAVDDLAGYDVDTAEPLLNELAALDVRIAKRSSKGHFERCEAEAAKLEKAARDQIGALASAIKAEQGELTALVAGIEANLLTFWKAIEGIRDTKRRDAYAKLHGTFKTTLDGHRAISQLQQLTLLQEALAEARTLEKNVVDTVGEFDKSLKDKVLSAVTGGKLGKGLNSATFDDVKQKIANQQERLKDKELRSFAGTTAFELDERLKAITKAIGSESMGELINQVTAVAKEIDTAEGAAKAERQAYDTFKATLADTMKLLHDKRFKAVPALQKAFEGKLAEVRAEARQQGGLADANVLHDKLKKSIEDGLASPVNASGIPVELADGQQTLVAEEEAKLKQKARWSGNVTVLEKGLSDMPKALSAEQDSLRDRLKAADKAYAKTGDYDAAWAQYSAIRDRLALVKQNPGGLTMHGRGQLPGVRARWVGAVTKLKDGLDKLGGKLTGVNDDPDLTDPIKTAAKNELTAVKGLFNISSFDKPVDTVVRPGADDKARAAAREQALREVRRMRDLIRNDQRLMILSQRTLLGVSFAGELSEASLALADMETNMLISL